MLAHATNNQKEDAHHWEYFEFASRRAHGNNMDARRDFFLVDVIRKRRHGFIKAMIMNRWRARMKDILKKHVLMFSIILMSALTMISCDKTTDHSSSAMHLSVCLPEIGPGHLPTQFSLDVPCFRDSSGDTLVFGFELAQNSYATLVVYDNSNNVVTTIVDENFNAGTYFPIWINPKIDEVYGVALTAKGQTTGATYSKEYWFYSR